MSDYSIKAAKERCEQLRLDHETAAAHAKSRSGDGPPFELYQSTADAIAVLLAHIERLEKAVKPFVAIAAVVDPPEADDDMTIYDIDVPRADLRRARASLSDIISLPEQKH